MSEKIIIDRSGISSQETTDKNCPNCQTKAVQSVEGVWCPNCAYCFDCENRGCFHCSDEIYYEYESQGLIEVHY